MSQEGKLELTDASRSAKTVAERIPEGFHPANSERVTAKAQERLAMPSPTGRWRVRRQESIRVICDAGSGRHVKGFCGKVGE